MDQLNKNRFLNIVIIILLIANLTTFGIFWARQTLTKNDELRELPRDNNNRRAVDFLSNELKFTDDQRNQFEQLKTEHRNSQEPVRRKIEKAKFDFFGLVKNDIVTSANINEAWGKVAVLEKEMDINTLNHFQLVRKICDSVQKIKFDSIIQKAIIQMRPRQQGPPPQDQFRKEDKPRDRMPRKESKEPRRERPPHSDGELGPPEGREFGPPEGGEFGPPPRRPNGPPDRIGKPPRTPGDSSRKGEPPPPPEN
jgi:hypothetical protein